MINPVVGENFNKGATGRQGWSLVRTPDFVWQGAHHYENSYVFEPIKRAYIKLVLFLTVKNPRSLLRGASMRYALS
jgi:hypothetical protein